MFLTSLEINFRVLQGKHLSQKQIYECVSGLRRRGAKYTVCTNKASQESSQYTFGMLVHMYFDQIFLHCVYITTVTSLHLFYQEQGKGSQRRLHGGFHC